MREKEEEGGGGGGGSGRGVREEVGKEKDGGRMEVGERWRRGRMEEREEGRERRELREEWMEGRWRPGRGNVGEKIVVSPSFSSSTCPPLTR